MKRRRTQRDKENNRVYQRRYKLKRKLSLRVLEFMERINTHLPPGVEYKDIRMFNIKVNHILRLPYRWTDEDLARAHKALDLLESDTYGDAYQTFTPEYEELLRAVMGVFNNYGGTTEERARVTFEVMRMIGTELAGKYGEKKPDVKGVMCLALASGMTPCTEWVKKDLAQFITDNFSDEEKKLLCEKISQSHESF